MEWLSENKLLMPSPSDTLDELYDRAVPEETLGKEHMLVTREQVQKFSKSLDLPALEIELERAIWQVEASIQKEATEKKDTTDKKEE